MKHGFNLHKLLARLFKVIAHYIIIQRQLTFIFCFIHIVKLHIVADVQRYVVVVDGIVNKPMINGGVLIFRNRLFGSVCHAAQSIRHLARNAHAVGLIAQIFLCRPPATGTHAFARNRYPAMTILIISPGKTSIPGGALGYGGLAKIIYYQLSLLSCLHVTVHFHKHRIKLTTVFQLLATAGYHYNFHVVEQIYLQSAEILHGSKHYLVSTGYRLSAGVYLYA